jgi:hypothetical protein
LDLTIRNLQESSVQIYLETGREELAKYSSQNITLNMKKLEIFEQLNADNFNKLISDFLNEALSDIKICLDEHRSLTLRFEKVALIMTRRDLIVKCPLELIGHLKIDEKLDGSNELCLASFAMVIRNKIVPSDYLSNYYFILCIEDKFRNKIFNVQACVIQV